MAADVTALVPGQVLSFELETKVLANEYQNCVFLAHAGYEIATAYSDVDATHKNIYSTLPAGIPDDARQYNYILVKLATGTKVAVGIPWIKDPIRVIETCKITVVILDGSVNDVDGITKTLNARGFNQITVTVEGSANTPMPQ